jgi:hypothetical protein
LSHRENEGGFFCFFKFWSRSNKVLARRIWETWQAVTSSASKPQDVDLIEANRQSSLRFDVPLLSSVAINSTVGFVSSDHDIAMGSI